VKHTMRFQSLLATCFGAVLLAALGCGCGNGGGDNATAANGATGATGGNTAATHLQPGDQNPDPNKIKIGLVASENGDLKPWGVDSVNGALLAVDEVNKAGGINGKQVQLLIEDSNSKPTDGKSAAEKLASKGVVGLIGEVASGITLQMGDVAKEKGIPDVAVGATRVDLTQKYQPNLVRVCYTDALQGPVMAKFAYDQLGLRNVALVTDKKQPYSTGLSDSFRGYFTKLGGKIVDEQFYESGQTQFSGILTNLKSHNPDGLFLSGYFTEVGPLVRQAVDAGINAKFLGGDGWDSADILNSGGDAILGSYFCNHYNNKEDRPEVKTFLSKWDKAFGGTPGTTMGALSYDATSLLCDAIKRAGGTDPKAIITALNDTDNFPGVSGVITLKGHHGDPPKRALVVQLTKDGQQFVKAYQPGQDIQL